MKKTKEPLNLTALRIQSVGFDVYPAGLGHFVILKGDPDRHQRFAGPMLHAGSQRLVDQALVTADGTRWRLRLEELPS
jgi:hypothetical protein